MTRNAQTLLAREEHLRASDARACDGRPLAHQVFFEPDSWPVPEAFAPLLAAHAAYLNAHPDLSALICGHSYGTGSHRFFWLMGERRALSVRSALLKAGVEAGRLKVQSLGAARPQIEMAGEDVGHYRRRVNIDYLERGAIQAEPLPLEGSASWWRSVMGVAHRNKLPSDRPAAGTR
jgi:peptidoglycan-associated lipoprotein